MVDQPKSTTKIPPEQKPRHRRSTPITTKKKKKNTRSTPIKTQTPPPLDQRFLYRWSTQINHQNPTGTKTQTLPINPDHTGKKKKKKPYQSDQNPDIAATAAARRFLHRWSTQINVSSTVKCDVGRKIMAGLKRGESGWERENEEREENRKMREERGESN